MINEEGHIVLDANNSKVLKSMKEVESYARSLKGTLRNLEFNSDSFKKTTAELQELNKVKAKLNQTLTGTNKLWESIKSQMISVGAVALGFLGFQVITNQIGNMIRKNAELSDSLAAIRQKTGMTQAEVEKLNASFSRFDTRTATKELRAIATELGALGITKDKIGDTTKAIDKLSVALEGEFDNASEVTRVTGTLRNILTDIKTDAPDQDMLHLGNALIELGNEGLATGKVVSDFATRIGGVGEALGLTGGQVLGISASMQELGLTAERGGTAVGKILLKMTQNVGEFAKIAGVPVAQFTKMLNEDLYGAFKLVLTGSQKSVESATALATILKDAELSGAGASEVFLKLGKNAGLMDEKVKLASKSLGETDKIMQGFALKNETFGAKLDKLGKALYGFVSNNKVTDFFEKMTDGLLAITDKTTDAEKAVNKFNKSADDYKNTSEKINPLLARYDELKSKTTLSKDEQAELKKIIQKIAETIPYAISAFDNLGNAMDINSGKAREYIEDMKRLMQLNNAEAIKQQTEALKDQELVQIRSGSEIQKFKEGLLQMDERYEAFKKANPDSSKYSKSDTQNVVSYKSAREQLMNQLKAEQKVWDDANHAAMEAQKNINVLSGNIAPAGTPAVKPQNTKTGGSSIIPLTQDEIDKARKALEQYIQDTERLVQQLREAQAQGIDDEVQREVELARVKYENNLDDLKQYEATIIAKIKAGIPLTEEEGKRERILNELKIQILEEYQRKAKDIIDKFNKKLAEDEFKSTLENLENTQAARRTKLKKNFTNGEIDQKTYNSRLFVLEQLDLQERKTAYTDYGKDVTEIDEKITDNQIKNAKEVAKAVKMSHDDWVEFWKNILKQIEQWGNAAESIVNSFNDLEQSRNEETFRKYKTTNDAQINDARARSNEEILLAEKQYRSGAISKETYDNIKAVSEQHLTETINGLNTNLDNQQRKLAYEQAKRDKNYAEFEAAIQGAAAIIKAYLTGGPILAAFTAGAVLLQEIAIESRPLPEYAAGGDTEVTGKSGKKYRTNYTGSIAGGGAYNSPSLGILAEKGPEYVIPNWIYTSPKMANVMGMIEAMRVRGYDGGGATGNTTVGNTPGTADPMYGMLMQLMLKFMNKLDEPFEANLNWDRLVYENTKIGEALDTGKLRSS